MKRKKHLLLAFPFFLSLNSCSLLSNFFSAAESPTTTTNAGTESNSEEDKGNSEQGNNTDSNKDNNNGSKGDTNSNDNSKTNNSEDDSDTNSQEENNSPKEDNNEDENQNNSNGLEENNNEEEDKEEEPTIPPENKFSINKTELELDYGGSRSFTQASDSLKEGLTAAFNKSEQITCNYTAHDNYPLNQLKVKWTIDSSDTNYFTVASDDTNPGVSVATITATKPSRLSTVTASLVDKNNESNVVKTLKCELRSVMVNAYWIKDYSMANNKLGGEDISSYNSGYTARLFSSTYSDSEDIVIPSKLKVGSNVKPLRRLVGFATTNGSGSLSDSLNCRNVFIPDSIIHLSSNALSHINTKDNAKMIFRVENCPILYARDNNFNGSGFVNKFVNKKLNLTFPYNRYATKVEEAASKAGTYTSFTVLTTDITNKNSDLMVFKKV